ncbi:MAG: MFS transporter [Bacteroides cellulosilyticus]
MIYQTKFYTDVFGLEGAIAGSVMLIARIVDAFVDPTVGILSDRTQTKWGKYRPCRLLWTALPFMVFYVLAFYNPSIEDKGLRAAVYATNLTTYASLMTTLLVQTIHASFRQCQQLKTFSHDIVCSPRYRWRDVAGLATLRWWPSSRNNVDKGAIWLCLIYIHDNRFVFCSYYFLLSRERICASNQLDAGRTSRIYSRDVLSAGCDVLTLPFTTTMWTL